MNAPGADRAIVVLVVLIMAVSGSMLWLVGLNYDGLTGNAAAKVHPASYLAVLLFALAAIRFGNPVAYLAVATVARPASMLLVAAGGLLLVQSAAAGLPGLAGAIDTFVLPGLLCLMLGMLGPVRQADTLAALETVVHAVLTLNALLGLAEFVLHVLVFPYRFDGETYDWDMRPTAMQGHPLSNAIVTAVYVLCLMSGGGTLAPMLRRVLVPLQLAALVAFGGRTALSVTAVLAAGLAIAALHRRLLSGRLALLSVAGVALGLVMVPMAAVALGEIGAFDAIYTRFTSEAESNNARVAMFALLEPFTVGELLIGPDPQRVENARRLSGLEMGVENPIIRFTLYNGILMTTLLFVAVVMFFAELRRISRRGMAVPLLGMTIVMNSFESIGSKSTLLAKFAVILIALFRIPREEKRYGG